MRGRTTGGTDPYVPGHGDDAFDVDHYDLDLTYKPLGNRLDGEAALTCTARADLSAIELDLHHLRVAKLWVDGKPARWTHRLGRVRVAVPKRSGTRFSVRLRYQGTPRPIGSRVLGDAGWEELTDGVIVAAQPHGAPSWFPCNDRPDNKATYRCRVTVPTGYLAVFSGEERDSSRGGSTVTLDYEQPAPMATYLATLQIGRYQRHKQKAPVPMSLVLPEGLRPAELGDSFGLQPDMIKVFGKKFGPYPFASYTSVVTDDALEIPLESQGLSTFGRNFCRPDWATVRLIAHELSHQWFGNAVTARSWRDIWLHEGFACYAEWIYSPHAGHRSTAAWADHYYDRLSALPTDLLLADPGPADMFDDRVYKRGALTLHALRTLVGDDAFFTILQRWVTENAFANVVTDDFVALCVEVAGGSVGEGAIRELFTAWLARTELPDAPWR